MSSRSSKKTTEARPPGGGEPPQAATAGERRERAGFPDAVLVGRVLRPHGVRGEVMVAVFSDAPDRFAPGRSLLVTDEEARPLGPLGGLGQPARLTVTAFRPVKAGGLVRFEGVDDRDRAAGLRGTWLAIERSAVPPAPPGTYYHYELLGCRCSAGGEDLGVVADLVEDGGGLLLILEKEGRRLPVPFVQSFLCKVDIAGGSIELDLPQGLIEACESTS